MKTSERTSKIVLVLRDFYGLGRYPEKDPFKVLISTILSQRTRDENTTAASQKLFSKYRLSFPPLVSASRFL